MSKLNKINIKRYWKKVNILILGHTVTIRFRIIYQTFSDQQILAVAGSENFCGNWNPQQAFKLSKVANGVWEGNIKLDGMILIYIILFTFFNPQFSVWWKLCRLFDSNL